MPLGPARTSTCYDEAVDLIVAIEASLAQWGPPVVESVVFGTEGPAEIAAALRGVCRAQLGARIESCSFYQSSVGCVAGLHLDDGRHVVLKVHQPDRTLERLRACYHVQHLLAQRGFACPRPIMSPSPLGDGTRALVTAEQYLRVGERVDGHDPEGCRAIARALRKLVELADPARVGEGLTRSWFTGLGERLWPRPHNALFDFEATAAGAEWIDELARRARAVPLAGEPVVGHFDWRIEHLLFQDGELTTAYDWDSVHLELEPVVVGAAAHAFTAQWDREGIPPAPTPTDIERFMDAYQQARGAPFSAAELATARAACVYTTAYTARCQHALAELQERPFCALLAEIGDALLRR